MNCTTEWIGPNSLRRVPLVPCVGLWLALYWLLGPAALFGLDPQRTPTQYTRAVWTEAQGLPQDYITAITQTADGYLWMGTNEGLTRFDGYDFVTFTKETGALPSNTVTTLAAGADNTLWIGTANGLSRYYNHRFTVFTMSDGLPDRSVTSICQDSQRHVVDRHRQQFEQLYGREVYELSHGAPATADHRSHGL